MDYNNYVYGGYQPQFGNSRFQTQQSVQMPQQNLVPTPMSAAPVDDRIWVQGRGAAEAYLVAPNGFARLWDTTAQIFYEKSADASGRPTMIDFSYTKNEAQIQPPAEDNTKDIEILTKEIKALKKRMERLELIREEGENDDE